MKLYNAWYCPFAQRAWMALIHKGIDFEYVEVDPYDKTDWWLKVSRGAALVPVVVQPNTAGDGETTVVESNRILEFLEDCQPDSSAIFSSDPLQRAEQKYWMDHIGNRITPYLYRFLKASEPGEYRDESRQKLVDGLSALVDAMNTAGPYFAGDSLGAAVAPWRRALVSGPVEHQLRRVDVLGQHRRIEASLGQHTGLPIAVGAAEDARVDE